MVMLSYSITNSKSAAKVHLHAQFFNTILYASAFLEFGTSESVRTSNGSPSLPVFY